MRVLIEVPTYSGTMEPETAKSLWYLDRGGHDVDLSVRFGYGVAMARNRIADHAIDGGYDCVLMVDADVELPRDALTNLLQHDADVSMGYYRNRWAKGDDPKTCLIPRGDDWRRRISVGELRELREAGTFALPVNGGGMGCCLIRTRLLRRMDFPWFEWHDRDHHAKSLGEDVDFCIKAQAAGATVVADTRVACGHKFRRLVGAE